MTQLTNLDPVLMNCVKMCDKEIDILIRQGDFKTTIQRTKYLHGESFYEILAPKKFNKKFIRFFLKHSRHRDLYNRVFLGT